jgi:hypothetical protein
VIQLQWELWHPVVNEQLLRQVNMRLLGAYMVNTGFRKINSGVKKFLLFFSLVFSVLVANAQKSEGEIFEAYQAEGMIYFDSVAKAKSTEFMQWHAESLYNRTRLTELLKKTSSQTPYRKGDYTELIKNIDQAILKEFVPPDSFFERVRKRFSNLKREM